MRVMKRKGTEVTVLNCKPLKGSQQGGGMMCSVSKMTDFLHGEFVLLYNFLCQLLPFQS